MNTILQALTVTEEFPPASSELLSVSWVVQEVLEHLDPATVQDYTLQVQIAESIHVWADPQFLRQILRNLLSNAFKYAPPQTVVCIEATQRDSASSVCLYVQDAGPGIPPNEQPLLLRNLSVSSATVSGPCQEVVSGSLSAGN